MDIEEVVVADKVELDGGKTVDLSIMRLVKLRELCKNAGF